MKTNSCYACGKSVPELKINNEKYSFCCSKCTCSTKEKGSIFEALKDWNEGIIYPEDNTKFWKMMNAGE